MNSKTCNWGQYSKMRCCFSFEKYIYFRLSEKNALIGSMKCENETLKQKLTSLDAEIEKLKKKNNVNMKY